MDVWGGGGGEEDEYLSFLSKRMTLSLIFPLSEMAGLAVAPKSAFIRHSPVSVYDWRVSSGPIWVTL